MKRIKPREQLHVRIKRLRKESRMTQEEIAATLHINRLSVGAIEAGKRRITADELSALCDLFRCSADELLFGKSKDAFQPFFRTYEALSAGDKKEVLELMEFKISRRQQAQPT